VEGFDYIIVGAGSAGCVLAERLTASGRHRVLLLEEGPADDNWLIGMPHGFGRLLRDPRYISYHPTNHARGEGDGRARRHGLELGRHGALLQAAG
jgi:choline dehydrogenase-like flavoprotein